MLEYEPLWQAVTAALLATLCLAASVTDVRLRRIPNALTFPAMLAALAVHFAAGGLPGLQASAAGLFGAGLCMFIPFAFGTMGAGDVKLMAACGAFLRVEAVLTAFLFTCLAGGVQAMVVVVWRNASLLLPAFLVSRMSIDEKRDLGSVFAKLPYGLAISAGSLATLYWTFSEHKLLNLF